MPLLLVKGLRFGLGMASEALHDLNDRSNATQDHETATSTDESGLSSYGVDLKDSARDNNPDGKHEYCFGNSDILPGEPCPESTDIEPQLDSQNSQHAICVYEEATTEEEKVKEREAMTRQLVSMAGPPPQHMSTQHMSTQHPLVCPVIIPQRRARQRNRGVALAYAPCLNECGISQEVFLQFIQHLNTVNQVRVICLFLLSQSGRILTKSVV